MVETCERVFTSSMECSGLHRFLVCLGVLFLGTFFTLRITCQKLLYTGLGPSHCVVSALTLTVTTEFVCSCGSTVQYPAGFGLHDYVIYIGVVVNEYECIW